MLAMQLDAFGKPNPAAAGYAQDADAGEWERQLLALVDDRADQRLRDLGAAFASIVEAQRMQAEEAARIQIAGGTLDPAAYPYLAALVGTVGPDIKTVAEVVWARSLAADRAKAAINGARVKAKAAIRSGDVEAKRAAFAVFLADIN